MNLGALAGAAALGVFTAALPGTARAQGAGEEAAAEALFKQGRDLMNAGKFAEACPKLAESERLDPATGTLLNLATCYERNGQLASAWVTYKEAASASQKANEEERVQLARRKAAELEPKLPMLTVVVPAASDRPDLEIKRDGNVIGRPAWGTPIPVDPGPHAVDATASGRKPWHGQVTVDGPAAQASLEVPVLEAGPAPEAPPVAAPAPALAAAPVPPPPPSNGTGQRVIGAIIGGVGVVGVALGAVFGAMAKSDNDDAGKQCLTDTACTPQALTLTTSAKHEATGSTVGFIAGGALLATGVVVFLTAPHAGATPTTGLGVSPLVGEGAAGLALRGGW
jgi:serine/threonine-protein kinase